jgi:hypothetical protein
MVFACQMLVPNPETEAGARGATQQAAGSDCRAGTDLEVSRCLILLVLLLLELGHLVLVREEVVMLVLVVTGWWGGSAALTCAPALQQSLDGLGAQHGGAAGRRTYHEEAPKHLHPCILAPAVVTAAPRGSLISSSKSEKCVLARSSQKLTVTKGL